MVANGPDTTPVKSSTRTPLSGPGMGFSLKMQPIELDPGVVIARSNATKQFSWARGSMDCFAFARNDELRLGSFGGNVTCLFDDRFFDIAELILAEEHFVADEERGRTKCTAVDGVGCQLDQPFLDVILLRARNQSFDIDP